MSLEPTQALSQRQKKLRLAKSFLSGLPLVCTWQLGRCRQAHCLYCEQRAESGDPWPDEKLVAGILRGLEPWGSLILALEVGGDGLARPDLPPIVSLGATRHFVAVVSRGWVCREEHASRLWAAGALHATIEIDSPDPDQARERVGWSGAIDRALGTARTLAAHRSRSSQVVEIRVAVGPGDTLALRTMIEKVQGMGMDGTAITIDPQLDRLASKEEGAVLARELVRVRREFPLVASRPDFLRRIEDAVPDGIPGCQAGARFLHIDHQGRLARCNRHSALQEGLGSITDDAVRESVARRRGPTNDCRDCWSPVRGEMEALRSWRGVIDGIGHLLRR